MKSRLAIVSALAAVCVLGAGAAHARTDVQWSVTIGSPVYGGPAPVYVPAPVYHAPAPVYYSRPPVYYAPAPVFVRPYYPRHPYAVRYAGPTRWDRDRDGIPDHRDRYDNRRWDNDRDGVPNRYDRHDHDPRRR